MFWFRGILQCYIYCLYVLFLYGDIRRPFKLTTLFVMKSMIFNFNFYTIYSFYRDPHLQCDLTIMPLDFILNQFSYFSYLFSSMVTNAVELQGHLDGRLKWK